MIRRLTEADGEAFKALRLEALETEPTAFSADVAENRRRPPEYWAGRTKGDADSFVLGAFADGRLAAMAGIARQAGAKVRHKAMIWGVYVSPAFRGAGLGRQLMERVLAEARGMEGLEQVTLSVTTTNTAAIGLYRSLGFQSFGTEPRALRVGDDYLDDENMVLFL